VVECQLPKLDVAGSSPVSRSMFQGFSPLDLTQFYLVYLEKWVVLKNRVRHPAPQVCY
jgi:hypothetical protein